MEFEIGNFVSGVVCSLILGIPAMIRGFRSNRAKDVIIKTTIDAIENGTKQAVKGKKGSEISGTVKNLVREQSDKWIEKGASSVEKRASKILNKFLNKR